jgi:hypothetical protein
MFKTRGAEEKSPVLEDREVLPEMVDDDLLSVGDRGWKYAEVRSMAA